MKERRHGPCGNPAHGVLGFRAVKDRARLKTLQMRGQRLHRQVNHQRDDERPHLEGRQVQKEKLGTVSRERGKALPF